MVAKTQTGAGDETDECTDKLCQNVAEFAYWMPTLGHFSRVHEPHPSQSYDDGDLHPHVCRSCRDRMAASAHWESERFVRPGEKLVTDGGFSEPEPTEIECPNGCGTLERSTNPGGIDVLTCSSCSYIRNDRSEEIREAELELRDAGVPERQAAVGARLMYERTRREISTELDMAPSTVDTHRQRVEERAHVARRLLRALESGEVPVATEGGR